MKIYSYNAIYATSDDDLKSKVYDLIKEYAGIGFSLGKSHLENIRRLLNDMSDRGLLEDGDE